MSIVSRISNLSISDPDIKLFKECHEGATRELGAIVGNHVVRHTEMIDQPHEKLDCRLNGDFLDRLNLGPLCELAEINAQVLKAHSCTGNRPKRSAPRTMDGHWERNRLTSLCWLTAVC